MSRQTVAKTLGFVCLLTAASTTLVPRAIHDEYETTVDETAAGRIRMNDHATTSSSSSLNELDVTANDYLIVAKPTTCFVERDATATATAASPPTFDFALRDATGFNLSSPSRPERFDRRVASLKGGAAVADYDRDGRPDVFFAVHDGPSRLYKNNGDGTFRDVSWETGIGPSINATGAVWADVDSDGDDDLFVLSVHFHHLYVNEGGKFVDDAMKRNLSISSSFQGVRFMPAVGDFNQDGYPDLVVAGWSDANSSACRGSQVFQNLGKVRPGFFEEVRVIPDESAICASLNDFDGDGWPDLALATTNGNLRVFWNRGGDRATFEECAHADCNASGNDVIGHAVADWNNDERLDLFLTGFNGSQLLHGQKDRSFDFFNFLEAGSDGQWGIGSVPLDVNNDGYVDVALASLHERSRMPVGLWINSGVEGNFSMTNATHVLPLAERSISARGILKFDYDGDGDEDILLRSNVGNPALYENLMGNRNYWLRVRVMNPCPNGNSDKLCDSLHARVTVRSLGSDMVQVRHIGAGAHFMAQNEIEAHFGLGSRPLPVNVRVYWPALAVWMEYTNVLPNRVFVVVAPTDDDSFQSNSTVHYSQVNACPRLVVTAVTQSSLAAVSIGSDARTVSVVLNNASMPQTVRFEYTIRAQSSTCLDCQASSALVTLNVRSPNPNDYCRRMFGPSTSEWRFDGFSNNMINTNWGAIDQHLAREVPSAYSDGLLAPAAQCTANARMNGQCGYPTENLGKGSTRPSARNISNVLLSQSISIPSARKINDLATVFGQFLAHDTDLATRSKRSGSYHRYGQAWMPITVPKGDIQFDPYDLGSQEIPFIRSTFDELCSGPAVNRPSEQTNRISSYIDGSLVYGHNEEIMKKLRTFENGKLILQEGGYPPFNTMGITNDNPVGAPEKKLLAAGDSRINETPPLTALHTLFAREHNRQCDEHLRDHPGATDEETFQAARQMVVAVWQAITFREFLPAIVGESMPPYTGYNASANADVGNAFATAAFRYGHSQVNSEIWRFEADWSPIAQGHLNLRDAFFSPERVLQEGGIDPILRGAVYQTAQQVDTKIVDELRNFMFLKGKDETLDLASVNIQRGRDHGLPDYNTARQHLGLTRYSSFSEITDDVDVAMKLENLYGNIDNVDLWVGGLAEKKVAGSELGPLFETFFRKNFLRLRDGDRFWYERFMTSQQIAKVHNLTLATLIRLNTDFQDVPENVFFSLKDCTEVRDHQCVNAGSTQPVVPLHMGSDCRRYFPSTSTRRLDGFSNNMLTDRTTWGSNQQYLVRDVPAAYADGVVAPSAQCTMKNRNRSECFYPDENGGQGCTRPSPRVVSNELFQQSEPAHSRRGLSDFLTVFGQFLAHDTDSSTRLGRIGSSLTGTTAWFPISVPEGDNQFDPYKTGKERIPFLRSTFDEMCTGPTMGHPAEQINRISSYIDASMVYGSDDVATKLRSMKNGKLIVQEGDYPPYNNYGLPNDNPTGRPANELLVAGDARINEQPTLIALHTLFVREHNRLCDEHLKKHPSASDEEIYQAARRIVIGEIQAITFREYLPAVIGREMPAYTGYNSSINADVGNAFSTAAFRFGHSQVGSELWRLEADGSVSPHGHLNLRDAYFSPERVLREGGIDPLLRGSVRQPAQEVDTLVVDELRNVLFPKALRDTLDLVSINIQRGRDHGLPDFNSAKVHLKQERYSSFSEITDDPTASQKLQELYHDVNNVDMWVGGLAEKKVDGSELGPLFEKLLVMNFIRVRDGDRFWYEKIMTPDEITMVHQQTMSQIIKMNTGYNDVPENVFFALQTCKSVENHQCVPAPVDSSAPESKMWKSAGGIAIIVTASVLFVVCCIAVAVCIYVCSRRRKEVKVDSRKESRQNLKLEAANDNVMTVNEYSDAETKT